MSALVPVMRNELRAMVRNRTALAGIALLAMLVIVATVVSLHHMNSAAEYRSRQQAAAQAAFEAQPDRHPHRVVHYGHFVYRLPSALAAFDAGVDPFTGSSMFLEGHRQNTANFGDVMQGSILTRFGQLTPAFVLQVLAPLVLVFLGHGVLSQERERGTLRQLMLQGASSRSIVGGKLGTARRGRRVHAACIRWPGDHGRRACGIHGSRFRRHAGLRAVPGPVVGPHRVRVGCHEAAP